MHQRNARTGRPAGPALVVGDVAELLDHAEVSPTSLDQTSFAGPGVLDLESGRASAAPSARYVRMATLNVPAHQDYLALARMAAMQVAGLSGLPVTRVADLRLAVDEACALFMRAASPHGAAASETIELLCDRYPDRLTFAVRGAAPARWPDEDDLGWTMLRALVADVRVRIGTSEVELILTEPLPSIDSLPMTW